MHRFRSAIRPAAAEIARRTAYAAALVAAMAVHAGAARAQAPPVQVPAAPDSAGLVLYNRPVMTFRAPLGASSPSERVHAARRRIVSIMEAGDADRVTTRPSAQGIVVELGGRPAFVVTPADADTLAGETIESAAERAAARLQDAIAAELEARSLPGLLRAFGLALLVTIAYIVALRALQSAHRAGRRRVEATALAALPRLAIAGHTLLDVRQVRGFLGRSIDVLGLVLAVIGSYLWLAFVLTRFPYTRPWGEALGNYLLGVLHGFGAKVASAVPGLLTVALIFLVTRFVTRIITLFFEAVETSRVVLPWTHPDTARPSRRIMVTLSWIFAVVVAYPYIPGSGSVVFKGVSVFLGLMISLGSAGFVNQAMSGLVLMYSRAFRPGEYLRLGDTEGTVVDLGMLATKVRTTKGELVTIPNALAVTGRTVNYSRLAAEAGVILYTGVTIGYDAPWRQVHALLLMAAGRTPGLRREPRAFVLQRALSDFYVEYELNAYLEAPEQRLRVLSDLHANIQDCFNEYGVQIMSPHFLDQPESKVLVPKGKWSPPPATAADGSPEGSPDEHEPLGA